MARPQRGDRIFEGISTGVAVAVLALLTLITIFLLVEAWPAFRSAGFGFFTEKQWIFNDGGDSKFGIAALVFGTGLSSIMALLFAVPVAVGSALFTTEYARPTVGRWIGYL